MIRIQLKEEQYFQNITNMNKMFQILMKSQDGKKKKKWHNKNQNIHKSVKKRKHKPII